MKRFLLAVYALFCISAMSAEGQNEVALSYGYSSFKGVEISGGFEVSFSNSDTYSVSLTVDELLEEYTKAYLLDGILHIGMDEKSFTPELKKALRGRNAIVPVMKAEVKAPDIEAIYLSGKAKVDSPDTLAVTSLSIMISGKASVNAMSVKASEATLKAEKSASAKIYFEADTLSLNAENFSWLNIRYSAAKTDLHAGGNSETLLSGNSGTLSIASGSYAKAESDGRTGRLSLLCSGSSKVCADSLSAEYADVVLSEGAECHVNVSDSLKVDLSGHSRLVFEGNPSVEVGRIVSSTMVRSENAEKKKTM